MIGILSRSTFSRAFPLSAAAGTVAFGPLGVTCALGLDDLVYGLASYLVGYLFPIEFFLFPSHPLHHDRLVVCEGCSPCRIQSMGLRSGSCIKVGCQLCCMIWGRETKVALDAVSN